MSTRSRFRLFGRTSPAPAPTPLRRTPALLSPPTLSPPTSGPATRHPTAAGFGNTPSWRPTVLYGNAAPDRLPTDDPPTDPRGFAPVTSTDRAVFASFPTTEPAPDERRAPPTPAWAGRPNSEAPTITVPAPRLAPVPDVVDAVPPPVPEPDAGPGPVPDPGDAVALACVFAADYLSWDEDDPARRGAVLTDHLVVAGTDPSRLGWSGTGRQRAEFVVAGRNRPGIDGSVLVDVTVRVTPYRRTPSAEVGTAAAADHDEPATDDGLRLGADPSGLRLGADPSGLHLGTPAVAPAPEAPGWTALASRWVRLSVPVVPYDDRWAVDAREEDLAEPVGDRLDELLDDLSVGSG